MSSETEVIKMVEGAGLWTSHTCSRGALLTEKKVLAITNPLFQCLSRVRVALSKPWGITTSSTCDLASVEYAGTRFSRLKIPGMVHFCPPYTTSPAQCIVRVLQKARLLSQKIANQSISHTTSRCPTRCFLPPCKYSTMSTQI